MRGNKSRARRRSSREKSEEMGGFDARIGEVRENKGSESMGSERKLGKAIYMKIGDIRGKVVGEMT